MDTEQIVERFGPVDHGAVLVLREEPIPEEPDDDRMDRLSDLIREVCRVCGHTDWTLLVLGLDERLEEADETVMRAAGWVRIAASVPVIADAGENARNEDVVDAEGLSCG